jgi:hypothetical protein
LFIHLNSISKKLFVVFRVNTYINILQSVKKSLQSISAQTKREGLFKEFQMKEKLEIIAEWLLAIIIFGGIGVLLAWRG